MAGLIYGNETHAVLGADGNTRVDAGINFQMRGRHPECNEGSITRGAVGYASGFFTAFRMTNWNTRCLGSDARAYSLAIGRNRGLIHRFAGEGELALSIWPRHERLVR